MYAWQITRDVLAEQCPDLPSAVGATGPGEAYAEHLDQLKRGQGHTFRMYDDDGELYFVGRAVWDDRHSPADDETTAAGPLLDYGRPDSGCTLITWHGRPAWTCEA